jgi:O-antigen ligase
VARRAYEQLLATLRESPGAPAGILAVLVILYWASRDGGFDALVYLPSTLFLVGLVVVVALTAPGSLPGGRAGLVALVSLAGYTAWCFLTIFWADVQADAWSGANKTLAFLAVYALFALRPWQAVAGAAALGVYALGVAAIGLNELITIARAADPAQGFIVGRLAQPISYENANAALYIGAAIPAVFLASRRGTPLLLRAAFLAAAGVVVDLAVMCQSRTSLLAVPLVALGYLAVVPGRLRSILAMGLVGLVVALSANTLLDVYSAVISEAGAQQEAVDDALSVVLLGAAALLVAGLAWGLADRVVVVPERVLRLTRVAVVAAGVAVAAVGIGAFVERYGDPIDQSRVWWERFKTNEYLEEAETPHFVSGFGSGRYEIWRVAAHIFWRHPVAGIGVDNFAVDFLQERKNDQDPLYPHSLELRALQQTGIVGTGLLLAFFVGVGAAAWRVVRRADTASRAVAGTALALATYWLVHGSVDWLWEIPSLSAAAFAALGLAVGLSPESSGARARRAALVGAVVLAVATLVTVVPPWLSARATDSALRSWRADTELAYERLEHARDLNPLSAEPDVLGAVIASQRGDVARQRSYFLRSLERDPHNWYPYLELGAIEARRGNRRIALAWLAEAQRLNPRDSTIRYVVEKVREGDPPTQAEIDAVFLRRAELLTGTRQ